MQYHFYAMLSRMKNIYRWGLMRNTKSENLSEHTLEVALVAHALAVIRNRRFDGTCDPCAVATAALFHDTSEILTGDMPTPVKYYNTEMRDLFHGIEAVADERLLQLLPADLQPDFFPLYHPDEETEKLIKAADKISALIKCVEEVGMGNKEFSAAEQTTRKAITELHLPEADVFLEEFMESFSLPLDSQC